MKYGTLQKTSKKATALISSSVDADEIKVKIISTESGSNYTLVDDDYYLVIGNAHGEGSSSPDAWSDEFGCCLQLNSDL